MQTQRSVLTQPSILNKRSFINDGTAQSRVEDALARLSGEDSELGKHLLDAAVAGAVVARQPSDTILRAEAAEAWNSIKPVIVNHLARQEEIILPWAKIRADRVCGMSRRLDRRRSARPVPNDSTELAG